MAERKDLFVNRELSWLEFNQRVLDEALDPDVPLLERLNFLAITASNLDEFFMVRVGGLQLLVGGDVRKQDAAGMSPVRQLDAIAARVGAMVRDQYSCYRSDLQPRLAEAGIRRIEPGALTPDHAEHLDRHFGEVMLPTLSPMGIGESDEFPALVNLRLHIAVRLKGDAEDRKPAYAVIPIAPNLPRFVSVPADAGYSHVMTEDVARMFVNRFFPGREVLEAVPFRITRNADIRVREDSGSDFAALMEQVLDMRKEAGFVRLEVTEECSKTLLAFLTKSLRIKDRDLFVVPGPLALCAFRELAGMEGYENLKYPAWSPQASPCVDLKKSIFDEISARDVLLHHPYESFEPVVRLVKEAAEDPDVLAIKQILYRTSADSPIVAALRRAAENGKYVTALIELKARFDEARNIEWAKGLERAGVQVIYGVKGLKTHAKLCIVVRRQPGGIVRYLHFGTGNYNERTARLYSDIGYMTRDPELGADATAFFNAVAGYSEPRGMSRLVAAPFGLREKILDLIENEEERKKQGQKALIRAKMNSLVCPDIIKALYQASQAGVPIELNVRGICCLRPGVRGLSETIRVVSIVDRFLEHSRVFHFHHGGAEKIFISSADWMPRNLDRRVELMVPIDDPACKRKLMEILQASFKDTVKARVINGDGTYEKPAERRKGGRSQETLCRQAEEERRQADSLQRRILEPLQPQHAPRGRDAT